MGRADRRYKRTNFSDSLFNDMQAWSFYASRLTELAISMFEWRNLPDTVDERYLELTLFRNGGSVFFKDETLGYLSLKYSTNGRLDLYGIPRRRRAYANNGYNKPVNENNSVIIFNNMLHTNSLGMVDYYAKRLWDIDCTIDVNARAQKTPVLIQCEENERLTLENLYKEYDGNAPIIKADSSLKLDSLKVLRTDAPFVVDKLYTYKTQLWNEALTCLGISNVSFQKKERMLSDEVSRSMGGVIASRHSRLESRREAVEKINRMFGLDIEVDYRADYREQDDEFILDDVDGQVVPKKMVNDLRSRSSWERSGKSSE